jgi:hypothetical protein
LCCVAGQIFTTQHTAPPCNGRVARREAEHFNAINVIRASIIDSTIH